MGRGSPVCQQIREKIIEMFKNNVPQRKTGRDLDISPSTVHNIIKRFKESGGISVRKGQGRKPKLNIRDLRSLRRHCIKDIGWMACIIFSLCTVNLDMCQPKEDGLPLLSLVPPKVSPYTTLLMMLHQSAQYAPVY